MKTKLELFLFMVIFGHFNSKAQTAKVLFINNNTGVGAAILDFEVRVMPVDTVFVFLAGINYLNATTIITVPANTILKLNYLQSGTSTVYYTANNVVFNPGEFKILFLYGTGTSKGYSAFTAYQQASSGNVIKFDFRHSTPTLQEIDLIIRETSQTLADNFVYHDMTSGFNDEFSAADYILDITPFDNNANGLFAYQFPGSSIGGEYILLFTTGTGSANDMYMAQMNGTVTKLTATTPLIGLNELSANDNMFQLLPNPAIDVINIISPWKYLKHMTVTIYNLYGQNVLTSESNEINVGNLKEGIYTVQILTTQTSYYQKLIIAK